MGDLGFKFQQVVNSGGSRRENRGCCRPPPPLIFRPNLGAKGRKIFLETSPSPLSKREWSTSFSLALSQDLNNRAPTYFKVWIRHWSVSPVRDSWSTPVVRKLESAIHRINSLSSEQTNRPLPSNRKPHFQNKAKCTTFLVKMSFICMRIKNHFHTKGWALNLVLIQRPVRTRKWPIALSSG